MRRSEGMMSAPTMPISRLDRLITSSAHLAARR
jgi:hypothetical protein